ncbi:hypothetical protein ACX0FK_04615 [Enterococcus faecium]
MFDFNEYLSISKQIESGDKYNSKESYRRTAVSRAYYSAFKKSDEYLKENYDIIYNGSSGKGSHQTVWNLFSTVKELNTLGIHNSGYRMLEKRKCADYIPNETITKTDMALMNREAEKIINKLT